MTHTSKASRIAARTRKSRSGSDAGRTRYHGQPRRGAPSRALKDAMDVRLAIGELEAAHELLVRSSHNATMTPIEKREQHRTALGKVGLAGRLVDTVILRPVPGK